MAELRFLPVCSNCRAVLDDVDVFIRAMPVTARSEKGSVLYTEYNWSPVRCPRCGNKFTSFHLGNGDFVLL